MPVTGLVVTMAADAVRQASLVGEIGAHPDLSCGPAVGVRLPVVAATDDVAADRDLFQYLLGHPDVTHVEVVFMDLSDVERLSSSQLRKMDRRRRASSEERRQHSEQVTDSTHSTRIP